MDIDDYDERVVKIAIIGECGVGKTTLANFLSSNKQDWLNSERMEQYQPYVPTVGCKIQVLSVPCPGTSPSEDLVVELWDVGGNPRFAASRNIFYSGCDGFMFVWDSSSEATYHSLDQWLNEVIRSRRPLLDRDSASRAADFGQEARGRRMSSINKMSTAFAGGIMSDLGHDGGEIPHFHFSPLRARTSSSSSAFAFSSFLAPPAPAPAPASTPALGPTHRSYQQSLYVPMPLQLPLSVAAAPQAQHRERERNSLYHHGLDEGIDEDEDDHESSGGAGWRMPYYSGAHNGVSGDNSINGNDAQPQPLDSPLVIVGSKSDKLSPSELHELCEACTGHVFLSTRSVDPLLFQAGTDALSEFFVQCWQRKAKAAGLGGARAGPGCSRIITGAGTGGGGGAQRGSSGSSSSSSSSSGGSTAGLREGAISSSASATGTNSSRAAGRRPLTYLTRTSSGSFQV